MIYAQDCGYRITQGNALQLEALTVQVTQRVAASAPSAVLFTDPHPKPVYPRCSIERIAPRATIDASGTASSVRCISFCLIGHSAT